MNFIAIEVLEHESPHDVVKAFIQEAHSQGLSFKRLEVLRTVPFGSRRCIHARTDCWGMPRLVEALRHDRAMIVPTGDGSYQAYLPGGRTGKVSHVMMQTVPKPTQRVYRGPAVKHWERQFR